MSRTSRCSFELFGAIRNFVAVGDSITIGFNGKTPYTSLLTLNKSPFNVVNQGLGGETLATMLSEFSTKTVYQFIGGIPNYVGLWAGTNDFANSGATVAGVYANLTSYVTAVHNAGGKVIVATMLSRTGTNPVGGETLDTDKNNYNALILANTAGADGIVDFTGTPLGCDGCYANTTWFTDGVHPTQLGITTYEGPIWSTAINALN